MEREIKFRAWDIENKQMVRVNKTYYQKTNDKQTDD